MYSFAFLLKLNFAAGKDILVYADDLYLTDVHIRGFNADCFHMIKGTMHHVSVTNVTPQTSVVKGKDILVYNISISYIESPSASIVVITSQRLTLNFTLLVVQHSSVSEILSLTGDTTIDIRGFVVYNSTVLCST